MNQNAPSEQFTEVLAQAEVEDSAQLEAEFSALRAAQNDLVAGQPDLQQLLDKAMVDSLQELSSTVGSGEVPAELISDFLTFWKNLNTESSIRALAAEAGINSASVTPPVAPMTSGFKFRVQAAENLRDPFNHGAVLGRATSGDVFTVIGELPTRGQYEYRLVENEAGQQFKICINDDLRFEEEIVTPAPAPLDVPVETVEPIPAAVEQIEATPSVSFNPDEIVAGQILTVSAADTLRTLDGTRSASVLTIGTEVTFLEPLGVSPKGYKYWKVEVEGEVFKLCINDTLDGSVLTPIDATDSVVPTPDLSQSEIPDLADPRTAELQTENLALAEAGAESSVREVYAELLNELQGLDIEDPESLGVSPVHITFFRGNPEISSGSWRKADTVLSSDNWESLNNDQRKEVVDLLNFWWNSNHGESLPPKRRTSLDGNTREILSYLSLAETPDEIEQKAETAIRSLVNFATLNLNQRAVALVAEGYQVISAKAGDEYANQLSQEITQHPTLAASVLYADFCEAVEGNEVTSTTQNLIDGVNLSELGVPGAQRPFVANSEGSGVLYQGRNAVTAVDLEGNWSDLPLADKAAVLKGLNDKIEPHYHRYDSGFESFAKDVLDWFGGFESSDTTQAVLARLGDEPNFLNTLPVDRQDEAACAAFLTRYFDNVYGEDFSRQSNLGGKNAWEYAKTLIDSGYAHMGADLSSFYDIDSERAQNERDKSAITLDNQDPAFSGAMDSFMESAFDPAADGGVVTFHYRQTAANDDIVNTPHASPNSHVTTSLGATNYEVPSTGRTVADQLMRHFTEKLGRHATLQPEYLQYLQNVQVGEVALSYDPNQNDFVGPDGTVFRPNSGDSINFQDVELAHFYHKHPDDSDPVRRDGLVALMATGLFEPVQVMNLNPDKVDVPSRDTEFNSDYIPVVRHSETTMSFTDIEALLRSEYETLLTESPGGEETVDSMVAKTMSYLEQNLYQSIFARSTDHTEKVFPPNSPLPVIDWRENIT